ncbi:MAG: arylamine N-acetyltransferase [Chlorobiaceae bacterium]|nr:arylamine N-acetyltransferase [Chlorobiaceae bacterium]
MRAANFDLHAYFTRIGFDGDAVADFATLKRMMQCQLRSVPFENLDVQAGMVVSLVPEELFTKIVERGRGGYCYEVNGLFAMALAEIGIPYRFVAARPMTYNVRRPKTHMAIVAEADGQQWLCDLGFGSYGIREPISLKWLDREIRQDHELFRMTMTSRKEYLLQSSTDGAWKNLYEFALHPQEWVDFEPANFLNSRHPDSIFVRSLMVVRQTGTGKEVLTSYSYKSVSEGGTTERKIVPEEIHALLEEKFGLVLRPGAPEQGAVRSS